MGRTTAHSLVTSLGLGFVLLLAATPSPAGILDAAWTAPTTNADGSALIDLTSYRVYYGTSASPCGGGSWAQVSSTTSSPTAGQQVTYRLTGLTTGASYNVAVTAVDAIGNESACSNVASAVSRAEFAVSPTGSLSFGSVTLGSFAEQTLTVSNTSGGTITGTVSVSAPFSIVSGTPFSLVGPGSSQAVKVRFTPTTTTTVSTTLTFTAAGTTLSVILTGNGAAAPASATVDATPPTVAVTAPGSGNTVTGSVTVSANATDNVGVVGVQFRVDGATLGAELTAPPYTVTWNTTSTVDGSHVLTAVARDAAGNRATSPGVSVSVQNAAPVADTTAPTISDVTLSVTSTSAVFGWTTNKRSNSQVQFGLTRSYGGMMPPNAPDPSMVTTHTQTLGGLIPNTWYYYRLLSRDANNNLGVSKDYKFKTRNR
jgi:hypothetical protein